MAKCDTCKHKTTEDGWMVCDCCIHEQSMGDRYEAWTNAERIRAMDDEALAWELMTWRCEAAAKYHGVESDYPNTQGTILKWLQQPCEGSPTVEKG